jgi:hypothetical protein
MQPYGPQPGWNAHPPPPAKTGTPAIVILAVLAVVGFVACVVAAAVFGFVRARERAKEDPATVKLTETVSSSNGLVTAHYPADFGAKKVDFATVALSRKLTVGDESITIGALPIDKAATDDIEEFARIILMAVEKNVEAKGGTTTRGTKRAARCLGKYDGFEWQPTFSLPVGGDYVGKACFFELRNRFHVVRYDVAKSQAEAQAPVLTKIMEATELADEDPESTPRK